MVQMVRQLTFEYDNQSMVETIFSAPDKPLLKRTWTLKQETAQTKAGKVQMSATCSTASSSSTRMASRLRSLS